ncbi:uncharacterized protein MICPUCDRAFT_69985 [Micromonas pusilla CCMP1545]|jgi:hypothetical protein|uniref:Predicted protein n=1 Tax=Micromonas pusilla (strain CCMP1545) TaxID=564608 RepID=C1N1R7_MICPC|nr:uncharacterized protein MICPUCDRAFT_69985 [Micromonas pusilla CCMP1545]EEH53877.1 predicted protein [Micromonas pusilla CCMP1545]|eukprot:XP_003062165.1 predicted protein [Micromonas pusilla CCMP1545]
MFAGEDAENEAGLSEYELERIARIRRNREIMKQLGLADHDIVSAARQRCGHDVDGGGDAKRASTTGRPKKKRVAAGENGVVEGARRSKRIACEAASHPEGVDGDDADERARGRRAAHDAYALDGDHEAEEEAFRLRWAGRQARVSIVGTASYQHTLMRVRTMDEGGLRRRVKAIERAKGKHAVVKMRLFARVLFLEGHDALSEDAAASLSRLIAELGDPEAEAEEEEEDGGGEGKENAPAAEKAAAAVEA